MQEELFSRIAAELRASDDPELWRLATAAVVDEADGLFTSLVPAARRIVLTFASIPARHPELHPDDAADWRISFERTRDRSEWAFRGVLPRLRRKRGSWWGTACVPSGSRRLAAAEVVMLWRPRAPWAPPDETEMGRVVRVFVRGRDGTWQPRGVREA